MADRRLFTPLLLATGLTVFAVAHVKVFLGRAEAGERVPPSLPTAALHKVTILACIWAAVVMIVPAAWLLVLRRKSIEIRSELASCSSEVNVSGTQVTPLNAAVPPGVLIASLEHVVKSEGSPAIAVVAGGLGKAMQMYIEYARHTRRPVKLVFPMVGDQEYCDFSPSEPILDGSVGVHTLNAGGRVEYIALKHPLFLERDRQSIYPDSRRPHQARPHCT